MAESLAPELKRRATQADRILARLRQGPATNIELIAIAQRFGARLFELKDLGVSYEKEPGHAPGVFVYTLTQDVKR